MTSEPCPYTDLSGRVYRERWVLYSPSSQRFWGAMRECAPMHQARRMDLADAERIAAGENYRVRVSAERGHPLEGHFGDWMPIRVVE